MSDAVRGNKVVILDRDGTIIVDKHYLSDPKDIEFLPGAVEGLRWFHENGYKLVIITNQSGIGRGAFSAGRLEEIHDRLREMMGAIGVPVAHIYHCPHVPDAHCDCRKPSTGLLLRAAADLQFDPSNAIVIGDKPSDIEFGHRVGAKTVLISIDDSPIDSRPALVAANLLEAVRSIRLGALDCRQSLQRESS